MTANKILFIVLDGISDRPNPVLGGTTPLAAARTPVLDKVGSRRDLRDHGHDRTRYPAGFDTAHLALLGYDPYKYYTGRGPLECEGSGIHMEPGMIGFRCNYATVSKEGEVLDRRGWQDPRHGCAEQRDPGRGRPLEVRCGVHVPVGGRAPGSPRSQGQKASGTAFPPNDPKKEGVPPLVVSAVKKAANHEKTAAVCNEFVKQSTKILFDHPINLERIRKGLNPGNIVLMRGAGEMGHFETFEKKYGLKGSVISAASLITGIGRAVGLTPVRCRASPVRSTAISRARLRRHRRNWRRKTSCSSTSRGPTNLGMMALQSRSGTSS